MRQSALAVVVGSFAALVGCAPKGPAPVLPETPSDASAREILIHNCGTCHRGELPDHKAAALAIFDLSEEAGWDRNLTREHLHIATKRLSATREEEAHFARWVEQSLPLRR